MIDGLCVKLKRPINVIRNELDNIDVMCPHGHYERAGRQLGVGAQTYAKSRLLNKKSRFQKRPPVCLLSSMATRA